MPVVVKTALTAEPLTLAEAKAHLRIDDTSDEAYITSLIIVARRWVEQYCGRALIRQTWVYSRDNWPREREISLPGGRMLNLIGCTYLDSTGTERPMTVLADTDSVPARVVLPADADWPTVELYPVNPVRVEYECGYGDAVDVPDTVKQAMLLLIGHWYEHREAVADRSLTQQMEFAVDALLSSERVYWTESR